MRVIANEITGAYDSIDSRGCVECDVLNNTILGYPGAVRHVSTLDDALELPCGVFANNIVYGFGPSDVVALGTDVPLDAYALSNNLWFFREDELGPPVLPVDETDGIYGEDPQFGLGLSLTPESPAAHAGARMPGLGPSRTVAGVGEHWGEPSGYVCFGDPPSIGAYELP